MSHVTTGWVGRISGMGTASIDDLEHFLQAIQFHPPPLLPPAPRPPPSRPTAAAVAVGAAALACVVLLIFVFWSAILQLRP